MAMGARYNVDNAYKVDNMLKNDCAFDPTVTMEYKMSSKLYDETFYKSQVEGSFQSATVFVEILKPILSPLSVADLGCGRGAWLKAFAEAGASKLVGFDGNWNSQDRMIDERIQFVATNLNLPMLVHEARFDLAISLEVAEHLNRDASLLFVQNITSLSDAVLFGAAFVNQGGTDHINERRHSYWAQMFIENGYLPYDLFRPAVWGATNVEFWYQQNAFLYVKIGSDAAAMLESSGCKPISNIEFMNCVHPDLLDIWVMKAKSPIISFLKKLFIKTMPSQIVSAALAWKKNLRPI